MYFLRRRSATVMKAGSTKTKAGPTSRQKPSPTSHQPRLHCVQPAPSCGTADPPSDVVSADDELPPSPWLAAKSCRPLLALWRRRR